MHNPSSKYLVLIFILCFIFLEHVKICDAALDLARACVPGCHCKWSGGKRRADCSNGGFSSIPSGLSSEIQALIMDGNPISSLEKDAFKKRNLVNLQRISLNNCGIQEVNENAFRDLKILGELDISHNNISKIYPKTFDGNDHLKILKLSRNPLRTLMAYQFPPMHRLKYLDLSKCQITTIDRRAFKNLETGAVESISLNDNLLRVMPKEVFLPLTRLATLTLYNNPWSCDCNLKSFRDYIMDKNLNSRANACAEPERLHNKKWNEIHHEDFACKPSIDIPFPSVYSSPGMNASLSCLITGSPAPQARWVVNGRIVNNNTRPTAISEQMYVIRESPYGLHSRWYNLTITKPNFDDLGEYTCVAENNGGVMEQVTRLTFDDPGHLGIFGPEELTIIIGATAAGLAFLILVLVVVCCCFCRKKRKGDDSKKRHTGTNGTLDVKNSESRQMLLPNSNSTMTVVTPSNPIPKPPRVGDYIGLPQIDPHYHHIHPHHHIRYGDKYDVEMTEMRSSGSSSDNNNGSRASYNSACVDPDQFPDLLDIPNRCRASASPTESGSTVPDNSRLVLNHHHHHHHHVGLPLNPATLVANNSSGPFVRSGTLPHRYRTPTSCDHSPVSLVSVGPTTRPGYVTLPRRPRGSVASSVGSNSSYPVPPPGYNTMTIDRHRRTPTPVNGSLYREPIYDGVGPRTSADGSSRLSLNKSFTNNCSNNNNNTLNTPKGNKVLVAPNRASPNPRYTLPPYYAPIEELAECPPTPKNNPEIKSGLPSIISPSPSIHIGEVIASTPADKKDSSVNRHQSYIVNGDLLQTRQQISPPVLNNSSGSSNGGNHIPALGSSASSETTLLEESLSSYCEPFGKAVPPPKDSSDGGGRNNSNEVNNESPSQSSSNSSSSLKKDPPPPTLPKPKVKPVPPPKPKKSNSRPVFQDEGVDGSEV
ncbi:uncharacterized protein [Lepeophtheirus salmonis]|uniref:uncharacterized protein n=1 Tax=Lepeophtheirus salmonis TaxID=72036 RepID=UPI001AE3AE05|nr:uncharacterized protein LOC121117056 [Lepeophtheirus salmonis]